MTLFTADHQRVPRPRPPPPDVSYAQGWTVDIYSSTPSSPPRCIYPSCSLPTLIRASSLFERLSQQECTKPLVYGAEPRISYTLPRGIADAAFIRIVQWVFAVEHMSGHGEIEDPQITTVESDTLTHLLRLLQASRLLELKWPLDNQKRVVDMIRAWVKKGFDTRGNRLRHVTISESEVALIWDVGAGDVEDPIIKLTLALFVDATDLRKQSPHLFPTADTVLPRFSALTGRNSSFQAAVAETRRRKAACEARRGNALSAAAWKARAKTNRQPMSSRCGPKAARERGRDGKGAGSSDHDIVQGQLERKSGREWDEAVLSDSQVRALMSRPEEFRIRGA